MKKSKKNDVRKMKKAAKKAPQLLSKDIPAEQPRLIDFISHLCDEFDKRIKHDWQPAAINWMERNKQFLLIRDEAIVDMAIASFCLTVREK